MSNIPIRALEPLAEQSLALLGDAALRSSLVLAAALALAFILRRRSAAHRHLVWSLAVAAALAMPVVSALGPSFEVAWSLPPAVRSILPAAVHDTGMPTTSPRVARAATAPDAVRAATTASRSAGAAGDRTRASE
ncbi:MAG: hypothetical protein R3266_13280, partial [Gemmatimonadota bacterium]|nr:hypothetical protein [Gemmatimonadota bacterium]